jgi:sortase A
MPLLQKQRRVKYSKQLVFKRRRRIAFLVLVLLAVLALYALGAYLSSNTSQETSNEPSEQTDTSVEQQPEETTAEEETTSQEESIQEEEKAPVVPDDPTLFLTVPRLGIYNHTVRNDRSEAALDLGAIKLPDTDFPWQKGPTNTYIACHRLGWPGLESFHQCLNLPSMQKGDEIYLKDTLGRVYEYRVSEFLQVTPDESWVANRDSDREMVSLQTCIETFGDFATLGPNWAVRFIVRADRAD